MGPGEEVREEELAKRCPPGDWGRDPKGDCEAVVRYEEGASECGDGKGNVSDAVADMAGGCDALSSESEGVGGPLLPAPRSRVCGRTSRMKDEGRLFVAPCSNPPPPPPEFCWNGAANDPSGLK